VAFTDRMDELFELMKGSSKSADDVADSIGIWKLEIGRGIFYEI
jgi:hypothetical protein